MAIWALADLHLSFGTPNKGMDFFGDQWIGWTEKVETHWRDRIVADDLVLVAGDISWATSLEGAISDLQWIHALPGTKVMIKGNHDYWWSSLSKVEKALPPSIHVVQNNAFRWKDVAIAGSRLWDTPEYNFKDYVEFKENSRAKSISKDEENISESEKIFVRELQRLELSLKMMDQEVNKRVVMTHYPPISADLKDSRVSKLLEKYRVDLCVFGHLHNVAPNSPIFGEKNGIMYYLTSCDYLRFTPIKVG